MVNEILSSISLSDLWLLLCRNAADFCVLTLYPVCVCASDSVLSNLCDPMDCSPPGSSVHGIFQARTLEWVGIPFSRGSSQPRDQTQVSCIAGRYLSYQGSPETLSNSLMSFSSFLVAFLGCSMCSIMSSANNDNFASFPIWIFFLFQFLW